MSVTAAFMVPHPPMIIPDVGRGSEKQITATIAAYDRVGKEIAAHEPETILILSPHATMYADYFHISPGKGAKGSFRPFHAPQVKFDEAYDTELVNAVCDIADGMDFPAGTLGERDAVLDHGTMVPLWFVRKYYSGGKIVRIGLSGLPLTDHYRLGVILQKAIAQTGRKTVVIASGDLSHKLQSYGPYGYVPEGPVYDRRIMDVMERAAFSELFEFDEVFCEKAAECGHRSFVIMAGIFDGISVRAEQLSHETITGVGYGICTFYPEGADDSRHFLSQYEEKLSGELQEKRRNADPYVQLAFETIETYIRSGKKIRPRNDLPEEMLHTRAGAFVSIHKLGALRGCIGTIGPVRANLAEEIIENAISAATRDPRFSPITADELQWLDISVDVLGEPEEISSAAELDVKRYGVIVSSSGKRGLLLPDLDGVDTVDQQISIAMQKGGIRKNEPIRLQRFEVVRHE